MAETTHQVTPEQIKEHIEARRGRISQDIDELEYRVRRSVDWRSQLREHTGAVMGAAFALGAVLGFVTTNRARREDDDHA